MSQPKTWSFIETTVNTTLGILTSYMVGVFVYPLLGVVVTNKQNLAVVLIFTIISFIRSYVVRRVFNKNQKTKE